jgi:hypothetical protein
LVSQANIIRFPKTSIFSITITILAFLRKNNIAVGFAIRINKVFAVGTRGYFGAYMIYTKSKVDLFYTFAGILGGYNKKEEKT